MQTGDIVDDRFVIEHRAGSGGMGQVYCAWDRVTAAKVALKVLPRPDPDQEERTSREASVLAELRHPGIVQYIAHGTTATGEPYLAMEWLEGEDVSERLAREGLSIADVITLIRGAAEALVVAHERGVVHRDIKPSNLFLPDGAVARVKLLDFGIARLSRGTREDTHSNQLIGTPQYMAPEHVQGEDVDLRADIYGLGCVLFECLTSRPAFVGQHAVAVLTKIIVEDPPPVSDYRREVPPALEALVAGMLAKDPALRPANATAVVEALSSLDDVHTIQPPPPARQALTGTEQRVFSVVMAGSAATTTRTLSPHETKELDSQLLSNVLEHGARLLALDRSWVVTLTGSGTAIDHAQRAARCALAIRGILHGVPMTLATGRGVLSARLPVGNVIDRATLSLMDAPSDAIRIDELTAGLLDERFDVRSDAEGFILHGSRDRRPKGRLLLGSPTPFVGRERELATLEATWEECVSEPMAQVVILTAPAGGGKTRLVNEMIRRSEARDQQVEVLIGHGEPMGAGSPFGLLADAIRRAAGIRGSAPPEVRSRKLRARLSRHLARKALSRATEFLGELVGVPSNLPASPALRAARRDAVLMGDGMRAAWLDWLAAELREAPVILVLEDFQWGDEPTIRFVDAALRSSTEAPLMVLAVGRPQIHTKFPRLWAERDVQEIRLRRLRRKPAERLVREVLGNRVSPDRVERLVEQADGNAFYLEELIRAVAQGSEGALPDTVLAMAEARLDALGTNAKHILRAASIFGQKFSRGSLTALLGGARSYAQVDEWLTELVEREVIARDDTTTFAGEPAYSFRHSLLREAAYAMLTDNDRQLGHRLAGDLLEAQGDTNAIRLAEHFDRANEPTRALRWYRRSARQALDGNDFGAALEQAQRAIACGATGECLGELRLIQAVAHDLMGDATRAYEQATAAVELLSPGSEQWYRAAGTLTSTSARLGRAGELLEWLETMTAASLSPGAEVARIEALSKAATQLAKVGMVDEAIAVIDELEKLATDQLNPAQAARVCHMRAYQAALQGDAGGFVTGMQAALEHALDVGDERLACRVRINLGCALLELGDYEQAEPVLRKAREGAEHMGLPMFSAWAAAMLAKAMTQQGRFGDARLELEQVLRAGRKLKSDRLRSIAHWYLARVGYLVRDLVRAETDARMAIELTAGLPQQLVAVLAELSRILLAKNQPVDALAKAQESTTLLASLEGLEEDESLVRLVFAEALGAAGEPDAAKAALVAARDRIVERAEKISDPAWRARFLSHVPDNVRTLALMEEWGLASEGGGP